MKLEKIFYLGETVTDIAEKLIGKELHANINGCRRAGIIVETEAYSFREKACHAYLKRNTRRTKTMFQEGGVAYIYLCYGIHHLINIVTNKKDVPEVVLIRALQPLGSSVKRITSGPGKLTRYMGITKKLDGISLTGDVIWLEDKKRICEISTDKRIGIDYAEEDALLPWRFIAKDNEWVSSIKC